VTKLRRHWLALHGAGTGRRFGTNLQLRRNRAGRYFLLRQGRLVWASRGRYPNDGGSVAFGPHEFAFASYRRGVFVTDLRGPERLVARGRGLAPYSFTDEGRLLVSGPRWVMLLGKDGAPLKRFRVNARYGYAFDERSGSFYFVTRARMLAVARGVRVRPLRSVARIDGAMALQRAFLVFQGGRSITITTRDGAVVARTSWRSSRLVADSGVSVSPDGRRFAFRLSRARLRSATVFVLEPGASQARAIYRHRLRTLGCAIGANMSWSGRHLLYSSADGTRAVIDTSTGAVLELTALARALPRLGSAETAFAAWRRDFRN
jgi:hypothetical protein